MPLTPSEKQRRYRERKKREKMEAEAAATETAASDAPVDEPLGEGVGVSGPTETSAADSLGDHEDPPPSPSEAPTEDPHEREAVGEERAEGEDPGAHDADDAVLAEVELAQHWYETGADGLPGPHPDEPKLYIVAWAQGVWMRHALKEQLTMPAEKLNGRAERARAYAEFYDSPERLEPLPKPVVTAPDPTMAARAAKRSSWDG